MTHSPSNEGAVKGEHSLVLDRRQRATLTGIQDVCSYHEKEIALKLETGMMYLTGEELHIARLLLEEGRLDVEGRVDGIVYETQRKPLRRLFSWKQPHGA